MVTTQEIEQVKLFEGAGERISKKVVALLREYRIPRDQAICTEGEPPGSMFIIRSGSVSVVKDTENGPCLLATLGAWDFFGEMGAASGEPRSATVRALEPTVVLELQRLDLLELMQAHPLIGTRIRNAIIHRQSDLVKKRLAGIPAAT